MSLGYMIAFAFAVIVACILGGKKLFEHRTNLENRRRAFARIAGWLRSVGCGWLPERLTDYSVGDYSTLIKEGVKLAEHLNGPGAEKFVQEEFGKIFERVLDAKLGSPEGRAYVAAKLQEAISPTGVHAVAKVSA